MYEKAQAANPLMSMFGKFMETSMSPMKMVMKDFPAMEMCRQMTEAVQRTSQAVQQTNENAAYATPELRNLFEDWLEQVENEALDLLSKRGDMSVEELSGELGITEQSAIFLLTRLTRQGKLDLRGGLRKTENQTADASASEDETVAPI
ncbi:hypothetical protein DENIS_2581 [Desulfonema ishimotonii]|uniref:Uncharacterized protein n=1 Tax=Desulfonema ishimotonii TaxID=45657 RepID=A0A401FXE6_9BACT|nr:hypothetical protein [Desulfonema ishimotonii]GBC61619.1 hypothetical protein DENIS_2581 [Desulfonema ishimotonii]